MCEIDWEEVHSCNNGGGIKDRKCTITIISGIEKTDRKTNTTDYSKSDKYEDDSTKTIDKSTKLENIQKSEFEISGEAGITGGKNFGGGKKQVDCGVALKTLCSRKGIADLVKSSSKTLSAPAIGKEVEAQDPPAPPSPPKANAELTAKVKGKFQKTNEKKDELLDQIKVC